MKKTNFYRILTPFIFAFLPVFSLLQTNITYVPVKAIVRVIYICLLLVIASQLLFYWILRDIDKSSVLTSIFVFILLSYGNFFNSIKSILPNLSHVIFFSVILISFIVLTFFFKNKTTINKDLNLALLVGGIFILLYLAAMIFSYEIKSNRTVDTSLSEIDNISETHRSNGNLELPDIYLLLLDGHTRSDILLRNYGFDNSDFINKLEGMGFSVAECAQANYPTTVFSVTTLFQMDYLYRVYDDYSNLVFPPLNETKAFKILSNLNYSVVTFQNFIFEHFNLHDDQRLSNPEIFTGSINEFEKMVVDTSLLRILVDHKDFFPQNWTAFFDDDFYYRHYLDSKFALDSLPSLEVDTGNYFVYAHLLVTHDPYVFEADGSFNDSETMTPLDYRKSVEFIDSALPEILEKIINNSETLPIIIVMGDHGSNLKGNKIEDRMPILLALYLQGKTLEEFEETSSPVNVFRIIFNNILGTNYLPLPDRSYNIWNIERLGKTSDQVYSICGE